MRDTILVRELKAYDGLETRVWRRGDVSPSDEQHAGLPKAALLLTPSTPSTSRSCRRRLTHAIIGSPASSASRLRPRKPASARPSPALPVFHPQLCIHVGDSSFKFGDSSFTLTTLASHHRLSRDLRDFALTLMPPSMTPAPQIQCSSIQAVKQ